MMLILAGCGAAATPSAVPAATTPTIQALVLGSPGAPTEESTALPTLSAPTASAAPSQTFTAEPFALHFTPVPSETPLPTLELPTLPPNPPVLQIWDGVPTYLAESRPGLYFRLRFDPNLWALTTDNFGFPALGHRRISDCVISPAAGRGLPLNATVEHNVRKIGTISYQVDTVYVNGVRQFVNYTGGDGNVYTAFEVAFQDQADQCLMDAEGVLGTLKSVPVSQATPASTP